MHIGREIKRYRKKYNLSLRDMGRLTGISYQAISDFEKGKFNPRNKTEEKILYVIENIAPKDKLVINDIYKKFENRKIGKLIVIGPSLMSSSTKKPVYICECECGRVIKVSMKNLTTGKTTYCGYCCEEDLKPYGDI